MLQDHGLFGLGRTESPLSLCTCRWNVLLLDTCMGPSSLNLELFSNVSSSERPALNILIIVVPISPIPYLAAFYFFKLDTICFYLSTSPEYIIYIQERTLFCSHGLYLSIFTVIKIKTNLKNILKNSTLIC